MFGGGGSGTGGSFGESIRSAVEHPALGERIEHWPLVGMVDSTPEFTPQPIHIRAQVSTPDPEEFEVRAIGQAEDLAFLLTAMEDAGLSRDDRVYYDAPPDGRQPYRLVEPQPTTMLGETHIQWSLVADTRGDGVNGTGGDTDPDEPDPDPDDDGNYEDGPPLFPS